MLMIYTYGVYIAFSVFLTVLVAQTLHKNGHVFLVDAFNGNEKLANSVNHLLVVGFYLINIGFVSLVLKYGDPARTLQEAIEYLSVKIGIVSIMLGIMHFINLHVLSKTRRRAESRRDHEKHRPRFNRLPEALPAE